MIIDLETQVWNNPADLGLDGTERAGDQDVEPWYMLDASVDAHDKSMRCVSTAVVLGFRSEHLGLHIPAETVASFVNKAPHRRIGFVGIDPLHGNPLDELDRAVSLGLSGVVVAPDVQNFHPTHSRAMRLYERCQQYGVPVIMKRINRMVTRGVLDYGRPLALDEVARSFPDLRIVVGQMGYPWIDETLVLVGKHRHVHADLAGIVSRPWMLYNALLSAFELGVMDKILFASDFPFETPERAIERIYSLNAYSHGTNLPAIPRQHLRGIVERDSLACLGLSSPGGNGPVEPARDESRRSALPAAAGPRSALATDSDTAPSLSELMRSQGGLDA